MADTEYKPKTLPRNLRGPHGLKLKQVRYQAFPHDIIIYHFRNTLTTVDKLRENITEEKKGEEIIEEKRRKNGYVDMLHSFDPIESLHTPMPSGDVIPPGRIEVAYLRNVFHLGGSALGFRTGRGVVLWMCFDQAIDQAILLRSEYGNLFDHVGTLPKRAQDGRATIRMSEHKGWYVSLAKAHCRPVRVKFVVKEDVQRALRERNAAETVVVKKPAQEIIADNWDADEEVEFVNLSSKKRQSRAYLSPPGSDAGLMRD